MQIVKHGGRERGTAGDNYVGWKGGRDVGRKGGRNKLKMQLC